MSRGNTSYRAPSGLSAHSPEPLEYASAISGSERTAQSMRQQPPMSRTYGGAYGSSTTGNGSLRSTRSSAGNAYSRGEHPAGPRMPPASAQRRSHGISPEGGNSSAAFEGADSTYSSQPHFQPYVPDAEERRPSEYYSGTRTIDYSYRGNRSGSSQADAPPQIMTSYPESDYTQRTTSMRRYKLDDRSDSFTHTDDYSRSGTAGNAGDQSPSYDYSGGRDSDSHQQVIGSARLMSGRIGGQRPMEMAKSPGPTQLSRLPSQRVEFGYTNPVKSTFSHSESPENDEIAEIIADMSRSRISPADISALDLDDGADKRPTKHVYLQLGDDLKRASVTGEPSQMTLINLFIEKYHGRLAEDPEALPSIYIKDSNTGVLYELEDTKEVVDGSVLSWKTKPLKPVDADGTESPAVLDNKGAPVDKAVPETNTASQTDIDNLAAIVKSLAEAVSQLPAQFKSELADVIAEVKGHADAAIGSAVAQLRLQPVPQQSKDATAADAEPPQNAGSESPVSMRGAAVPLDDNGDLGTALQRLERAELALSVERQARREAEEAATAEKAELVAQMEKLKKDVSSHPNVLRVRIEEGKRMLKDEYRAMNARFEDVHSLVQEMRKDVTQRGSIPSAQMLHKASDELKSIDSGSSKLVKFINDTRADWKLTWEEELQNILKEQSFVKDVEQMLGELMDDTQHLEDVLDKLDQIVDLKVKERSRDSYVPAAATRFLDVVSAEDAKDAKQDFLMQITCVDVDHDRRLDALKAAEKLRQQELANKVNEFDAELADFVGQRKLRKTGGTEELERRRAEKEVEVMKDMLKSVEEAEKARRAKIAQRKAAKKAAS
ncbi:hypothetical protein GQ54DRAFT_200846 [Martensiomyces pterosporus]|nr:hypothetical protein GQ54DRAFT_200846 [Martensiomyces pterosporus]